MVTAVLGVWLDHRRRGQRTLGAFLSVIPLLNLTAKGDGHPVLVLPGLMAGDDSTMPLREFLKGRGYQVRGWELDLIEACVTEFRTTCSISCAILAMCTDG